MKTFPVALGGGGWRIQLSGKFWIDMKAPKKNSGENQLNDIQKSIDKQKSK